MKHINTYIFEKLHLNKSTDVNKYYNETLTNELLKHFKGVPEDKLKYYIDKYYLNDPFDEEISDILICTSFELLFMLAAMLVDDGADILKYEYLGYKGYKRFGYKNNPYDYSWFEEENDKGETILEYLQNEWIPDNYEEFEHIYNLCKTYKKILTIDKIWDTRDAEEIAFSQK